MSGSAGSSWHTKVSRPSGGPANSAWAKGPPDPWPWAPRPVDWEAPEDPAESCDWTDDEYDLDSIDLDLLWAEYGITWGFEPVTETYEEEARRKAREEEIRRMIEEAERRAQKKPNQKARKEAERKAREEEVSRRRADAEVSFYTSSGPSQFRRNVPEPDGFHTFRKPSTHTSDLSQFGKAFKHSGFQFDSSSAFSRKYSKREASMPRPNDANRFAALSVEEHREVEEHRDVDNKRTPAPALTPLSEIGAWHRVKEDVKEYLSLKNVDEAIMALEALPTKHRHLFVGRLVNDALDGGEDVVVLAEKLFEAVRTHGVVSPENFECGLLPTIKFADKIHLDIPRTYEWLARFAFAAGFDWPKAEELARKIEVEGESWIHLRSQLLKEFEKVCPALEAMSSPAREEEVRRLKEEEERKAKEMEKIKLMKESERHERAKAKARAKKESKRKEKEEKEARLEAEAEAWAKEVAEVKAKQEAERKAREEEERKAKEEEERRSKEKAERKARAREEARERKEARRKEKEERDAQLRSEAEAKARGEAKVRARQEAERKAREEEEGRVREEEERRLKEEAERKARLEAEANAKVEEEDRAKEEAERRAKEEAERKAKEEEQARVKAAIEAKAREAAATKARLEAERKARELEERRIGEEERKAREEQHRLKEEAEQRAREEARLKAEAKAKADQAAKAKEEAERKAKEEEARLKTEVEAKAREEARAKIAAEAAAKADEESQARDATPPLASPKQTSNLLRSIVPNSPSPPPAPADNPGADSDVHATPIQFRPHSSPPPNGIGSEPRERDMSYPSGTHDGGYRSNGPLGLGDTSTGSQSLPTTHSTPPSETEDEISPAANPLEPVVPLKVSENRWVGGSMQSTQQKIQDLLNKLTMDNFGSISHRITRYANRSEQVNDGSMLMQVVELVFASARNDPIYAEMYAQLCHNMTESLSPNIHDETMQDWDEQATTGGMLFRKYLFASCQAEFQRGWNVKGAELAAASRAKRRGLGLVRFMGELFSLRMLTERTMHGCIKKLLSNVGDPKEEDIESLCELLTTVGRTLDNPKARSQMNTYFKQMKELRSRSDLNWRIRFMLLDVIELRARQWQARPSGDSNSGLSRSRDSRENRFVGQQD